MKPKPIKPKAGQESVWDYPRPPALEPITKTIKIIFNKEQIALSNRAYRVLETSHPPVYYISPADVRMDLMEKSGHKTWCEWKGEGSYYNLQVGNKHVEHAAWYYSNPTKVFRPIKDYLAFYAHKMDACYIDDQLVEPQPGNFYGGWITPDVVGPFKGGPGTYGW